MINQEDHGDHHSWRTRFAELSILNPGLSRRPPAGPIRWSAVLLRRAGFRAECTTRGLSASRALFTHFKTPHISREPHTDSVVINSSAFLSKM
jgi:hypothetical protein